MMTCSTCSYWKQNGTEPTGGTCRRYAPQPRPRMSVGSWPKTQYDDWCGDHSDEEQRRADQPGTVYMVAN